MPRVNKHCWTNDGQLLRRIIFSVSRRPKDTKDSINAEYPGYLGTLLSFEPAESKTKSITVEFRAIMSEALSCRRFVHMEDYRGLVCTLMVPSWSI